jgi:hypothetical protein
MKVAIICPGYFLNKMCRNNETVSTSVMHFITSSGNDIANISSYLLP